MSASRNRLYFLLQVTAHRLKKHADEALIAEGSVTATQAAVLEAIAKNGPVSQRRVADILSQRESAMTPMMSRLLKAGHISKIRSSADRRAWQLQLTSQGAESLRKIRASFTSINALIDTELGLAGVDNVTAGLKKLLNALNETKNASN